MVSSLDASDFREASDFKDAEFQDILKKIADCYKMMLSDNAKVANNENKIRDELVIKYLNNKK